MICISKWVSLIEGFLSELLCPCFCHLYEHFIFNSTNIFASTTECTFIPPDIQQTTISIGAAVGIAEGVICIIIIVVGVVAGVLVYHCTRKHCPQNPRPKSSSNQQQAGPVYDEVPATSGEERIELRDNKAYEPVLRIELRENVAYECVQH